jgi:hypothetical protein
MFLAKLLNIIFSHHAIKTPCILAISWELKIYNQQYQVRGLGNLNIRNKAR